MYSSLIEFESERKVAQSCPTLCDPVDYTVHEILHARTLEWVAFFPSLGDLPNPGSNRSPILQADALPAEPQGKPLYRVYQRANESLAFFFYHYSTSH